ncbi:DeoR/GlpR family DNA-binding transcription regulator [Pseudooceanicola sp. CBS1P-1]|uniref:DeoR family transcriptional regulator n=1 Tax=Pseudooceanicola albus TaxID=2692189 RepID=A0A6L7G8J6_9RHOB|nr:MULTISPECIES: DeoR/GlpR family DNA-binding transcription regulator [Pseudooceanicola]MBT9385919.1 DeoR/GlpR family DNA-binding transcription regulator [Pseudooceanicola endophyticus]MXN19660.1 DeoR family transcriptional regulator [Pseudooceanicola albus]
MSRSESEHKPVERAKIPAQVRLAAILERLRAGGSVTVTEIARDFHVSDMTVRRDLSELEREGLLERVHGGAVLLSEGPLSVIDDVEPRFGARAVHMSAAKTAIAREAARLVAGYRTVAMDVGTTTHAVAQMMEVTSRSRIFTNSLRVAEALSPTQAEVYVPGGRVRPDEMSITGPQAVEYFEKLHFDVALLGISGLTGEGLFDYSMEDSELKRVYVARSATRVVLCDSSKFRRMSLTKVCDLSDVQLLITDAAPPADLAQALERAGVEIRIAP